MMEHKDHEGAKIGMWLFIFTELLLFGGLFIIYAVYRYRNPEAFHISGEELDVTMGIINTVILLISSMTMAMAVSAIQKRQKGLTLALLGITILIAIVFMVNKYFEWGAKIDYGFYPGSEKLFEMGHGTTLFFGLYYMMTGLHAVHIIIGVVFMALVMFQVKREKLNADNFATVENCGLYWHLVDLIWIFLFPLFYLIH